MACRVDNQYWLVELAVEIDYLSLLPQETRPLRSKTKNARVVALLVA